MIASFRTAASRLQPARCDSETSQRSTHVSLLRPYGSRSPIAFGFTVNSGSAFYTMFALEGAYLFLAGYFHYIWNNPARKIHLVRQGNTLRAGLELSTGVGHSHGAQTTVLATLVGREGQDSVEELPKRWYNHISIRQPSWQNTNKMLWAWAQAGMMSVLWAVFTIASTNNVYGYDDEDDVHSSPWTLLLNIIFVGACLATLVTYLTTAYIVWVVKQEEAAAQHLEVVACKWCHADVSQAARDVRNVYSDAAAYADTTLLYIIATTGVAVAGDLMIGSAVCSHVTQVQRADLDTRRADLDSVIAAAATFWLPAVGAMIYSTFASLNIARMYRQANENALEIVQGRLEAWTQGVTVETLLRRVCLCHV